MEFLIIYKITLIDLYKLQITTIFRGNNKNLIGEGKQLKRMSIKTLVFLMPLVFLTLLGMTIDFYNTSHNYISNEIDQKLHFQLESVTGEMQGTIDRHTTFSRNCLCIRAESEKQSAQGFSRLR